jgi:hypothetical protein
VESGSRGFIKKLFCNFWTFLQVSTNFGNLPHFLEFKTIENELKFTVQCWAESRPAATVCGLAACHTRPARRPGGPWPGGPRAGQQVSRLEHHRPSADAPGKKSGGGAHQGGGTTVGWRSRARSTTFGGDGAGTVVADGRGVLLQLGGGGQ